MTTTGGVYTCVCLGVGGGGGAGLGGLYLGGGGVCTGGGICGLGGVGGFGGVEDIGLVVVGGFGGVIGREEEGLDDELPKLGLEVEVGRDELLPIRCPPLICDEL